MENKTAYCRGYIKQTEKKNPFLSEEQQPKINYPRVFVFDTETTIDTYQNLKVGYFEIYEKNKLVENGFFYNELANRMGDINIRLQTEDKTLFFQNPMAEEEVKILLEYAEKEDIKVYTKKQFLENIFFLECYMKETPCIGYNLPFDLARIAGKAGNTVKNPTKGDILLSFPESESLPDITIGRMGLAETVKFKEKKHQEIRIDKNGKEKKVWVLDSKDKKKGKFFDCSHLYSVLWSSGNTHFSLEYVTKELRTEHQKKKTEEHGIITEEYLEYCINDVKATYDVYKKIEESIKQLGLMGIPYDKLYSGASIGKQLFKQMGIKPFKELSPKYPVSKFGIIMETFYAGRVECKLRHEIRDVEVLDFTSMYPTVVTLLNLWDFIKSKGYIEIKATEEIKEFLGKITLDDMVNPETWKSLVGIVKIKPDKDILPIRAGYSDNNEKTVGLQYISSDKEIWYTLADIVASKLLSGKIPEIIEAYKYKPASEQKTLFPQKILGYKIDPRKINLIKFFVEERQKIKKEMEFLDKNSSEYSEKDGKQLALKILSNALGYGIFVELITEDKEKEITVNIGEERFNSFGRYEKTGKYFNPLIGTTITAASRLMLAIAEAKVKELEVLALLHGY